MVIKSEREQVLCNVSSILKDHKNLSMFTTLSRRILNFKMQLKFQFDSLISTRSESHNDENRKTSNSARIRIARNSRISNSRMRKRFLLYRETIVACARYPCTVCLVVAVPRPIKSSVFGTEDRLPRLQPFRMFTNDQMTRRKFFFVVAWKGC